MTRSEPPDVAPIIILVVDDMPENLQLLAGMLRQSGYKVRPVASGKLAIQAATLEPPDLVLLDIRMPEMSGYEVCEQLKAIPELGEVPVIFISGLTDTIDKVRAFAVGGVDYVTRPFQLEEVEARVRTHLDLRQQKRKLQESYHQLAERTRDLEEANRKLAALSDTDGLTGIANRRRFDEVLVNEWGRASRSRQPLALAMLDVDLFKSYNDQYGHQAGDDCLRSVSEVLKSHFCRASDLAARYGGEEFALIAPATEPANVLRLAEAMRVSLESLALPHAGSPFGRVTVSIGVAGLVPTDGKVPLELLRIADEALYNAKGYPSCR